MAKAKSSPIVALALVGISAISLYYVWEATTFADDYINNLPVHGQNVGAEQAPSTTALVKSEEFKALNPLLVESSKKAAGIQGSTPEGVANVTTVRSLDDAFVLKPPVVEKKISPEEKAKQEIKKKAPPKVKPIVFMQDHFAEVPARLLLNGLSKDGAMINGRFYAKGELLDLLEYPDNRGVGTRVPVLAEVGDGFIVIQEQGSNRTLKIQLEASP
jgi:hypothetical protein